MGIFSSLTGAREKEKRMSELKKACETYEGNRQKLLSQATALYNKRKKTIDAIKNIINLLGDIQNLPQWCTEDIEDSMNRTKDFRMAVEYENDPKKFAELTDNTGRTAAYVAGAGAAAGVGVGAFGAAGAMSIATLMGTASTGAAISSLSGIAATNAALAWLGGGAVAAGGGGMVAGNLVLAMFGPIGAAIAGASALGGLAILNKKNREKAEEASKHITDIQRDNDNMQQKLMHLNDIMGRSELSYKRLGESANWTRNVHPKDYSQWDDNQKHELERLMNAVGNSALLINERI